MRLGLEGKALQQVRVDVCYAGSRDCRHHRAAALATVFPLSLAGFAVGDDLVFAACHPNVTALPERVGGHWATGPLAAVVAVAEALQHRFAGDFEVHGSAEAGA